MTEGGFEKELAQYLGEPESEANKWVNAMKKVLPKYLAENPGDKLNLRTLLGIETFVNGGNRRKDPNTGEWINDEEGNPTYSERYWDIKASEGSYMAEVLAAVPLPDEE